MTPIYADFGTAGNSDSFYAAGFKASVDMPAWLEALGLTAYEYQCSRGANVREATARAIGQKAAKHRIKLSIHAPYYISLATEDPQIAANTVGHFVRTVEIAHWMGADRVVFHIGGVGKQPRTVAMNTARRAFANVLEEIDKRNLSGIYLAPETMGKINQLGTLGEVLELCTMSQWMTPAVDFGHLYAVTNGGYTTKQEFQTVFDRVEEQMGYKTAGRLHIHFSKIEFTKAGEKRHWTFADSFGPPHEPLLELCSERGYTPRFICESAGTQAEDAKTMLTLYRALRQIEV